MQFIALIYSTEGADDVDWETLIKQYGEFGQRAQEAVLSFGVQRSGRGCVLGRPNTDR